MRVTWPRTDGILVRCRMFLQSDLVLIRKLIRDHPSWGRTKLSEEVCRSLDWRQDNGRLKDRACRVALLKLERSSFLQLPPRKLERGGQPPRQLKPVGICEVNVTKMPMQIRFDQVQSPAESRLWNGLIAQYHYLGLATPVGRLIRYLVFGDDNPVAAISFADPAWSLTDRDRLLRDFGASKEAIRSTVVSNNRFLILPHIQVRNLASRILALSTRQLVLDWSAKFGNTPDFIETFVDPTRFEGTCYRAANWTLIGETKGYTKKGATHKNQRAPKLLFMIGTSYNANSFLRSVSLTSVDRAA